MFCCAQCSVVLCDGRGHLASHLSQHSTHNTLYSHKLRRMVSYLILLTANFINYCLLATIDFYTLFSSSAARCHVMWWIYTSWSCALCVWAKRSRSTTLWSQPPGESIADRAHFTFCVGNISWSSVVPFAKKTYQHFYNNYSSWSYSRKLGSVPNLGFW